MRKDMKVEQGDAYLRVADSVVDGVIKASSTSVSLPCDAVDGDVLISLDVNGTAVAHRELFKMSEGSVAVGDYTVAYSSGAVTISTTSNNDVVSICIEPVEVVVSDAFRAAVGNATPEVPSELPAVGAGDKGKYLHANESTGALEWAEVGGSGGGRFVVTFTYDEGTETWSTDKTLAECAAAWNAEQTLWAFDMDGDTGTFCALSEVITDETGVPSYFGFTVADAESNAMFGYAIDAEGAYYYGS